MMASCNYSEFLLSVLQLNYVRLRIYGKFKLILGFPTFPILDWFFQIIKLTFFLETLETLKSESMEEKLARYPVIIRKLSWNDTNTKVQRS